MPTKDSRNCRQHMRWSTIEERFARFVKKPTADNYRCVRQLVLAAPEYDPYLAELECAVPRFHAGDFQAVLQTCDTLDSSCCLSPRYHFYAGVSAGELGDPARSRREKRATHACLRGLRETGDGSAHHPFLVTYLSDEYDLLRSLQAAEVRGQELVETSAGQCDVVHCRDGSEFWFDVTELLAAAPSPSTRKLARVRPSAV